MIKIGAVGGGTTPPQSPYAPFPPPLSFQRNTDCPSGGLPVDTAQLQAQVFAQPPPKTLVLDPAPAAPRSLPSEGIDSLGS